MIWEFDTLEGYNGRIWVDSEATGLKYPKDFAFMLSVTIEDGRTCVADERTRPDLWNQLASQVSKHRGPIVAHNMSYDYKMMLAAGYRLPMDRLEDTVVRAVCIDENLSQVYPWTKGKPVGYGLDSLGKHYLKESKDNSFIERARDFFGDPRMSEDRVKSRMYELPYEILAPYAKQDTVLLRKLWLWQEDEINTQGIRDIVEFEMSVMPSLIRAECRGIHVDTSVALQAIDALDIVVDDLQKEINHMAGFEFNVNSSKQVIKVFEPKQQPDGVWVAIDGTPLESTGSGGPSFGGSALREMSHPLAAKIVELRSSIKTRDTFLKGHILGHEVNGIVYPNINQTASEEGGTRTGRLSYTDPAMQQIPSRNKKVAAIVKPVFLPPPGMIWLDGDMQSFEVRVFAHLVTAYNQAIQMAYEQDPMTDFHRFVAELTGLPRDAEYSGQANSKQLNLSMIFNSGKGSIAHKMGMPWEWAEFKNKEGKIIRYKKAGQEAERVIELYHSKLPGIRTLADRAKSTAENRGYIKTSKGRRLRFRNKYKSYSASGLLIQATSADLNKENWVLVEEALGSDGHLILNTHDSYSMAVNPDWEPIWKRVKESVERPRLRVPLILELSGAGSNWWDAIRKDKPKKV